MAPPRRPNNKKDIPRAAAAKAPAVGKEEENACKEAPNCSCLEENVLTCDICLEVMHNAMNISPCNHKFCAACIYEWLDRNTTCPKCRWRHSNVTRDPLLNQIIDNYLEKNPARGRSEVQLAQQDELELKHLRQKQANREADESDLGEDEDDSMEVDDPNGAADPVAAAHRDIRLRLQNVLGQQVRLPDPFGNGGFLQVARRIMDEEDDDDDDDTASMLGFHNRDQEYRHAEEDARIERLQRQKEEREAKIRAQSRPANRGARCANRRATPVAARRSNEAVQQSPRQYNLRARRNVNA